MGQKRQKCMTEEDEEIRRFEEFDGCIWAESYEMTELEQNILWDLFFDSKNFDGKTYCRYHDVETAIRLIIWERLTMSMTIGERLKRIIRMRGMTQKQLAEKAGIPEPSLSQYLRGKRIPRTKTIQKICDALSISPLILVCCENTTSPNIKKLIKPTNLEKLRSVIHIFDEDVITEDKVIKITKKGIGELCLDKAWCEAAYEGGLDNELR